MNRFGELLKQKREAKGLSQDAAGTLVGLTGAAFGKLERGETIRPNNWRSIAEQFDIAANEADALIAGDAVASGKRSKVGTQTTDLVRASDRLFRFAWSKRVPSGKIPILGNAAAGDPNRLIMLNEVVDLMDTPPELAGVPDGYAVYVHGTSMVPRYFPGEKVYVHPHKPVAKDNFCVIQIGSDPDDPEAGFIKQFISWDSTCLRAKQYNPAETLTFKSSDVLSVHRIVGSGD